MVYTKWYQNTLIKILHILNTWKALVKGMNCIHIYTLCMHGCNYNIQKQQAILTFDQSSWVSVFECSVQSWLENKLIHNGRRDNHHAADDANSGGRGCSAECCARNETGCVWFALQKSRVAWAAIVIAVRASSVQRLGAAVAKVLNTCCIGAHGEHCRCRLNLLRGACQCLSIA